MSQILPLPPPEEAVLEGVVDKAPWTGPITTTPIHVNGASWEQAGQLPGWISGRAAGYSGACRQPDLKSSIWGGR